MLAVRYATARPTIGPNKSASLKKEIKEDRILYLDGVRGFAAIMVLVSHLIGLVAGSSLFYRSIYFQALGNGPVAVHIFFIVSAFALSIGFIKSRDVKIIETLALRRYLRLVIPIFCVCLISFLFSRWGFFLNKEITIYSHSAALENTIIHSHLTVSKLLKFAFYGVFFEPSLVNNFNAVLWTMNVEFLGSMFIFFVLAVFGKVRFSSAFFAMIGVLVYIMQPALISFVFGLMLATISEKVWFKSAIKTNFCKVGGLFGVALFFYLQSHDLEQQGVPEAMSVFALIAVVSVIGSSYLQCFFETKLLQFLGRISFPLYLIHPIVLCSLSCYQYKIMVLAGFPYIVVSAAVFLGCIAFSVIAAVAFMPVEKLAVASGRSFAKAFGRTP